MFLVAVALMGAAATLGVAISLMRDATPPLPTVPPDRLDVVNPKQPTPEPPPTTGPAKLQGSAAQADDAIRPAKPADHNGTDLLDTRHDPQSPATPKLDKPVPETWKPAFPETGKPNKHPTEPGSKHVAKPVCDPFAASRPGEECLPEKPGTHTN